MYILVHLFALDLQHDALILFHCFWALHIRCDFYCFFWFPILWGALCLEAHFSLEKSLLSHLYRFWVSDQLEHPDRGNVFSSTFIRDMPSRDFFSELLERLGLGQKDWKGRRFVRDLQGGGMDALCRVRFPFTRFLWADDSCQSMVPIPPSPPPDKGHVTSDSLISNRCNFTLTRVAWCADMQFPCFPCQHA